MFYELTNGKIYMSEYISNRVFKTTTNCLYVKYDHIGKWRYLGRLKRTSENIYGVLNVGDLVELFDNCCVREITHIGDRGFDVLEYKRQNRATRVWRKFGNNYKKIFDLYY